MQTGYFYFIKNEYYEKFRDKGLMGNKNEDVHGKHGRPCFYCFKDSDIHWMIPISSKTDKYQKIYDEKIKRYPNYDGVRFGYVNGYYRAFLIQNICPVTEKYIEETYKIENNITPVMLKNEKLIKELNGIVRKVIRLYKKGTKIILTDLDYILAELENELIEAATTKEI